MVYFAPTITSSGLSIPTYQDVENLLVQSAQSLFGADIVLDPSSQDFQDIAARAQAIYDGFLAAQQVYNDRAVTSAIGAGLDSLLANNGLQREASTYSICPVICSGSNYSVITNGVARDVSGYLWSLPSPTTIGSGGTVSVTATCQTVGAITALTSQINEIYTPTSGWISVTNPSPATPGQAVELDSSAKNRQAISVSNPSQALTTGILGAVLAIVGQGNAQIYENQLGDYATSINGVAGNFPPHSLTLVINGGQPSAIASAIALRKTPGCYLAGDQSYTVYDTYAVPNTIRWYLPLHQTIDINITIKALNGYTSTVGGQLVQNIVTFINSLLAAQNVYLSEISAVAMAANTNPRSPFFSIPSGGITISIDPAGPTANDIILNFQQQAVTTTANINLTVT